MRSLLATLNWMAFKTRLEGWVLGMDGYKRVAVRVVIYIRMYKTID